jgi:PA14 domain/PEP-CTERM motif
MRKLTLLLAACLLCLWHDAGAVTIGADQSAGAVPMDPGTGLLGSYYKLNTTFVTTMAQATQFISASGGPTATFTTTAVCYPNCNISTVTDASTSLAGLLNGNAANLTYTVPPSQIPATIDHSAMVLTGYIAIAQAGTYNFNLASDDGAQLTIGNQVVIAGSTMHSFEIDSGQAVFATAGLYAINIQYFENSGYAGLEFWGSNGSGTCIVGRSANCIGTAATGAFYSTLSTSAPEPGTLTMFTVGLGALAWVRRRGRRAI